MAQRKSIDCRDHPSEKNCSLRISGTEQEVLDAAGQHNHLKPMVARLSDAGIRVTRRTVAKYREDMRIPSTHQRRVKS